MPQDDSFDLEATIRQLDTPSMAGVACQLGIMLWQNGDFESAVRLYQHALTLFPEPSTHFNLAIAYDDWGREEEAVRSLRDFYVSVASPSEVASAEEMLRDNGKSRLIRSAKAAAKAETIGKKGGEQPGSQVSYWCAEYLSRTVSQSALKEWRPLPDSPNTHGIRFQAQDAYCDDPASIYLFVVLEGDVLANVSYTIAYVSRMGEGNEVTCVELAGDDVVTAKTYLDKLTGE